LQLRGYTDEIIAALGGIASDPTCCQQIVGVLSDVDNTLSSVASNLTAIAANTAAPINWIPVSAGLSRVANAISAIPPAAGVDLGPLTDAVNQVARAISSAPATDVTGIVDQLKALVTQGDVDQPIIDALGQAGILQGVDLQVLQGIKWSDALTYLRGIIHSREVIYFFRLIGVDITTTPWSFTRQFNDVVAFIEQKVADFFTGETNALMPPMTAALDALKSILETTAPPAIGNTFINPDLALAKVVATGINMWALGAGLALVDHGAGEAIEKIADYFTGILGLEEIREVQIGPLVEFGVGRDAEHAAKARFRQELPGNGELYGWHAMGLMSAAQADAISAYNGLHDAFRPLANAAAHRGLNARQMLRLIETDLFTSAEIADELTFSAMRPVSQDRMIRAAPYLATAPMRSQLRSALEAAHTAGILSDADLTSNLDAAESNFDRDNLILQASRWKLLVKETATLEAEYATLFRAGLINDIAYRNYLTGIGLQPGYVNIVAGKAEAQASAALYRKELAAAAALERETNVAIRRAALQNYKTGAIDAAGYAAALIATGLTPLQSAAWTDLATLQISGSLRWEYGLELPAQQATLLRERVTALTDQAKRQQITIPIYVAQLQALGIPPKWVNALEAAAASTITPKSKAITIPVGTG
jgi:hypothetical protein